MFKLQVVIRTLQTRKTKSIFVQKEQDTSRSENLKSVTFHAKNRLKSI